MTVFQSEKKEGETAAPAADAPKDDKADKEADKKKKAHKSINLVVKTTKPRQLSPEQLNELIEAEAQFTALDRQEVDRENAKNSLEEYIYDMRDKLETFGEYFDPKSIDTLKAKLDEYQNWLDEDGSDQPRPGYLTLPSCRIISPSPEYATRLQSMTAISGPALALVKEHEKLPEAEKTLRTAIVQFRKFVDEYAAGSEKYKHIDAAEAGKVSSFECLHDRPLIPLRSTATLPSTRPSLTTVLLHSVLSPSTKPWPSPRPPSWTTRARWSARAIPSLTSPSRCPR